MLGLSSALGGDEALHGARAFEGFLAAADRFNKIMEPGSGMDTQASDEALMFLYDAVRELELFGPRRAHEPALPDRFILKFKRS